MEEIIGLELLFASILVILNVFELFVFVKGLDSIKQQKVIISLIISDILFAVVAMPLSVLLVLEVPKTAFWSCLMISCYLAIEVLETLCIMVVLVEKFFAKLYPMKFFVHATGRTINAAIAFCWTTSLSWGISSFLLLNFLNENLEKNQFSYFQLMQKPNFVSKCQLGFMILGSFVVAFTQLRTFAIQVNATTSRVIVYQNRRKSEVILYRNSDSQLSSKERPSFDNGLRRNRVNAPNASMVVLRIIFRVCIFLSCRLPIYSYFVFSPEMDAKICVKLLILSHFSVLWNPILYVCHLSKFKEAFRRIFLNK
ncbi:adenosine receptor A3-like [Culicoides brevitarsis]|uniref:adenosine receptor A3-like n=1 Tax=Culicoides brevitarsis TaxID=469753 RepID=UPI00307C418B